MTLGGMSMQQLTRWLRERGMLTISCGSRVCLTLALHNGESIETEPMETLDAAVAQLLQRTKAHEAERLRRAEERLTREEERDAG